MRTSKEKTKINYQSGAAMLISVIFFLFISLAIILGLVSPTVREFKIANDLNKSSQSLFLSESGVEDAYFRLKNEKPIGSVISLALNNSTATTNISDSGPGEKIITALGDVFSRQRRSEIKLGIGTGISFGFNVQAGVGGITMGNNSFIEGSAYSNGDIAGGSGAMISGSATSASSSISTGIISGVTIGANGEGDAYAHTINDSNVAGTIYCQNGSNNNKPCDTGLPDPAPITFPISDQNILDWKNEAELGGTHLGDYKIDGTSVSLGPRKITGNLIVTNNAFLTLTGNLWVVGNINISNNAIVSLSPSYGVSDGVIITDGIVNVNNNATFNGSGSEGSFILVLSTSDSTSAITLANNGGAVILYAADGTVELKNNALAKSLNGKHINLNNNAVVLYDEELANFNFVNGASGEWEIKSWREIK